MLWTGFLLGFFGSLHCLGMCGPIAVALPTTKSHARDILARLIYNLGRIFTYALLGALIGLLGQSFNFGPWQQILSVSAGLLIIVSVLGFKNQLDVNFLKPLYRLTGFIKKGFKNYFNSTGFISRFVIGVLNGFLPCGLVYIALAGSLAMGEIQRSAFYMMFFGLGTLPMMLATSFAGQLITPQIRLRMVKLVPIMVTIIGVLFIVRGLSLDIPMLSPDVAQTPVDNSWGEVCE